MTEIETKKVQSKPPDNELLAEPDSAQESSKEESESFSEAFFLRFLSGISYF